MDKSLLLSGQQLLDLKCLYAEEKKMRRKKKRNFFNVSSGTSKRTEMPSTFEMQPIVARVEKQLRERYDHLGIGRTQLSRDMGIVEWCPQARAGKVISAKKRPPWMGFTDDQQLMYSPEETVFLMEAESILVKYLGAQLGLQSAYELILAENRLGKDYQIYSHLTRLGFKLKSSRRASVNRSPSQTFSSQSIKDAIEQQISQFGFSSVSRSASEHLKLVKMPLRRGMFLNGTGLEKTATWAEYKRLIEPRGSPSVVLDEEATVLELTDEIRSKESIFDQLPNKSLVDPSTDLKPLIDQTKVMDINRLQQIWKDAGPREQNLHQLLPPSRVQPVISYQLFKPTTKTFTSVEPDHRVAICQDRYPPMIQELMTISEESGQSTPIYAMISHGGFSINTIEPFDLWQETPTTWDSSLRR